MTQLTAPRRPPATPAPQRAANAAQPDRRAGPAAVAVVAVLFLGPLPMLLKLGRSLWEREQYQFFPLMILGAALVAWERWQDLPGRNRLARGSALGTAALLVVGAAILVASDLMWVRSLSLVATIVMLAAVAWHAGGGRLLRAMVPALVLLAVCVPPPGRQEQVVTLRLQHLAVGLSCRLLDVLHVPNVQAGNVIEIPGRRLLIEQACSGINSLMAVLAFTLLYAFYLRRPAWRLAVLLPVAVLFVVGGNVVRITGEATLWTNHHIDVTEGVAHMLLGLTLFAGCVALVASFDAAIGGTGAKADEPSAAGPRWSWRPGRAAWAVAWAFLAVGVWTESRVWAAWRPPSLPESAVFDLPPAVAGWDKVNAESSIVERPQTEAAKSYVWQFRRGNAFASVAIDYPFVGYHPLVVCYATSGWAVRTEAVDAAGGGFTRVTMDKPDGYGYLAFSQSSESGQAVTSGVTLGGTTAWQRLAHSVAFAKQTALAGPTYQVQVLVQTPARATDDQRRAADELFRAVRADLLDQLRAQVRGHP